MTWWSRAFAGIWFVLAVQDIIAANGATTEWGRVGYLIVAYFTVYLFIDEVRKKPNV